MFFCHYNPTVTDSVIYHVLMLQIIVLQITSPNQLAAGQAVGTIKLLTVFYQLYSEVVLLTNVHLNFSRRFPSPLAVYSTTL